MLAVVPILFALLNTNKIQALTSFDGGHIGFKFGLPVSVVTIWQFVSVPKSGVAVETSLPIEMLPVAILTVPALLVVQATVTAGYFGSLRNALDEAPYDFVQNCRQYFLPFVVLTVLPFIALLPLAVGVFGIGTLTGRPSGAVLVILLPGMLAVVLVAYLFYATPYLIVLRDIGLLNAARQSYTFAMQGGPYFAYAGGFFLFVFLVSPVATGVVVNVPLVGLPVGVIGGGALGLGANFATMRFVADLDPSVSVGTELDRESVGSQNN